MVQAVGLAELRDLIAQKVQAPSLTLVLKRGYPPREVEINGQEDDLKKLGFKTNENLIIEVDMTRLPKVEDNPSLIAERKALVAKNQGCDPANAT